MSPIHILLIKSDSVLAHGIEISLEAESDFVLLQWSAKSDGTLILEANQPQPNVAILEIGLETPVREPSSQIKELFPNIPIISVNSSKNWVKLNNQSEAFIDFPAELFAIIRQTYRWTENM